MAVCGVMIHGALVLQEEGRVLDFSGCCSTPAGLEEQLQAPSAASDEGPAVDAASPPVAKSTVDLPDLGVGL